MRQYKWATRNVVWSAHSARRWVALGRRVASTLAMLVVLSAGFAGIGTSAASADPVAGTPWYTNCASVLDNLVANCGFEAGPFGQIDQANGWSTSGGLGSINGVAHSGSSAYDFVGNFGGSGVAALSQTIAVAPNTHYSLSYFLSDLPLVNGDAL